MANKEDLPEHDDREVHRVGLLLGSYKGTYINDHVVQRLITPPKRHKHQPDEYTSQSTNYTLLAVSDKDNEHKVVKLKDRAMLEQLKTSAKNGEVNEVKIYAVPNDKLKECEIPGSAISKPYYISSEEVEKEHKAQFNRF
jgi:hypothetical protein